AVFHLSLETNGRMYCPPGWLNHGSNCYFLVSNSQTWINAENHCAGLGSSLVSIQNPSENQFLQSLMQMSGHSITWTGGFYFQGRWMWVDQSRFYYNNWGSTNSASSYPCVYLRSQGGWSNYQCTLAYPFICVKKLNC
uniref:C-type lectin domain-containing protein n=1 Tax=Scleropages formosus TaxID=113540 RepID=A0A8C9RKY1_SCLFO